MPKCLVKQPDGLYAVWSSILNNFNATGFSASGAAVYCISRDTVGYPGGLPAYLRDLATELDNIERTGRAWDWAPTWDEAQGIVRGEALPDAGGAGTRGTNQGRMRD